MHKRVMALLLSLVLLLSAAMPVTAMAAEKEYAGSFVFVAMNANSTIVEPTRIQYKSGQTIQQALADSDIDFVGLENGFVYEINGVSANYLLYYDKGGYKLDAPASSVKALCFHVSSTYSDAAIQLIIQMADYLDMTNHVQNYPAAANAYATALKGLRTATADSAGPLLKNLKDAIAEYAALLDGTKYTVSATATQNGNAVEAPILSLTDVYGNVTTGTGSVQVIAGDYKFCVSDGGYNRTEGTLTVSADAQVSATLPYGEWFGNIRLLDVDQEPYRAAQNRANHTAQYWIEDTANALSSVYLNVVMGNVPNTKTTRLRTIYTGTNGKDMSGTSRSWNSIATSRTYLLTSGMEGKTFALEAQYTGSDGYTQIQSYDVTVTRVPTLKALAATAEGTKLPLEFAPNTREYSLKTVSSTVDIDAAPFGEDYTVTGTGAVQLTGEIRFRAGEETFWREKTPDACPENTGFYEPFFPTDGAEYPLPGGQKLKIRVVPAPFEEKIQGVHKKDLKNQADYAKITMLYSALVLRHRRPGDTFCPAGRGVRKELRKWMNETGIPPEERDRLPLLAAGSEVVWVCGAGFADGLAPTADSEVVLQMEAQKMEEEQ